MLKLSSLEMESESRVQILVKAIFVLFYSNALQKNMNPSMYGRMLEQIGFFCFRKATNLEGKNI